MSNLTLKDRLRLDEVERWHTVPTTRSQTVAGHTYGVIVIAQSLAQSFVNRSQEEWPRAQYDKWMHAVLDSALNHDVDEVLTGDIPSPNKEPYNWDGPISVQKIVKIADVIETWLWIRQYKTGHYGVFAFQYVTNQYTNMITDLPADQASMVEDVVAGIAVVDYALP